MWFVDYFGQLQSLMLHHQEMDTLKKKKKEQKHSLSAVVLIE